MNSFPRVCIFYALLYEKEISYFEKNSFIWRDQHCTRIFPMETNIQWMCSWRGIYLSFFCWVVFCSKWENEMDYVVVLCSKMSHLKCSIIICIINSYAYYYYYWWCNCARDLYVCVWFVLSFLFKSSVVLQFLLLLGVSCSVFRVHVHAFMYLSSVNTI